MKSDVYKRNICRANELDAAIIALGSQGEGERALKAAKELLALYDAMGRGLRGRVLRRISGRGHVPMHDLGLHQLGKSNGAGYETEDGLRSCSPTRVATETI